MKSAKIVRPLNAGDVVSLGSDNGPRMTIERITIESIGDAKEEVAHCVWFDIDESGDTSKPWTGPHREKFALKALRIDEEGS